MRHVVRSLDNDAAAMIVQELDSKAIKKVVRGLSDEEINKVREMNPDLVNKLAAVIREKSERSVPRGKGLSM